MVANFDAVDEMAGYTITFPNARPEIEVLDVANLSLVINGAYEFFVTVSNPDEYSRASLTRYDAKSRRATSRVDEPSQLRFGRINYGSPLVIELLGDPDALKTTVEALATAVATVVSVAIAPSEIGKRRALNHAVREQARLEQSLTTLAQEVVDENNVTDPESQAAILRQLGVIDEAFRRATRRIEGGSDDPE